MAELLQAKRLAVRWAIETALPMTVGAVPASSRGPVTLPVPEPSALIAMEDRVHADPRRADKRATDLLRSDQRRSSRSCGLASPNNR
jgi:hypothetical protein